MINASENVIAAPAAPEIVERCCHPHITAIKNDSRASQRFIAKPGSNVFYTEGAGAIRDMSMDGIFILDSEPLAVGTPIMFSFHLGNETAVFQGIVRRSVTKEGMGIQFQEMSREIRRRLLSHIVC